MSKYILLFAFLVSFTLPAQVSTIKIAKEKPPEMKPARRDFHSLDLSFGYLAYQDNFYQQLNTGEQLNFNLPPQLVGIGVSGYNLLIGPTYFILQMDAQKYLPQFITLHDTIQATYSGARFGLGAGKRLASADGNYSLSCYLGFYSGRSTLKGRDFVSVQKPFFCPKISIQPKLFIRNVALSLTITAQGDISSLKWFPAYRNGKHDVPVANMSQTGISALLGLGYRLGT